MSANKWLEEILKCKECKFNFDGKGGFEFCDKHWREFKEGKWRE